jgi:hypothetical protein
LRLKMEEAIQVNNIGLRDKVQAFIEEDPSVAAHGAGVMSTKVKGVKGYTVLVTVRIANAGNCDVEIDDIS